MLRTDYFLQGVPIPAGTHEIRLTYRDQMIGRGLALSALVWLRWLAALGAAWMAPRMGATTSQG